MVGGGGGGGGGSRLHHASCLRTTAGRRYSRGLLTYSLPFLSSHSEEKNYDTRINSQTAQKSLGLRGGPTLSYIGPTSGLREGGPT